MPQTDGLEVVPRFYFLQQWFALSAPRVEEAEYESPELRGFARIGSPPDRFGAAIFCPFIDCGVVT